MEVIIIYGPTGTGKTHWAYEHYPDLFRVPYPKGSGTYWDDYQGEETVLVDEMYGHYFAWGFLLQMCDKYAFSVPVHGGKGHQFISKRVIFTSNVHPKFWYTKPEMATSWDERNPLRRRVSQLIYMSELHGMQGVAPVEQPQRIAGTSNNLVLPEELEEVIASPMELEEPQDLNLGLSFMEDSDEE